MLCKLSAHFTVNAMLGIVEGGDYFKLVSLYFPINEKKLSFFFVHDENRYWPNLHIPNTTTSHVRVLMEGIFCTSPEHVYLISSAHGNTLYCVVKFKSVMMNSFSASQLLSNFTPTDKSFSTIIHPTHYHNKVRIACIITT